MSPPSPNAVLLERAARTLKLAYEGHCGRPGHRGGSRPKNACGALPAGLAAVKRAKGGYRVERSVKRGSDDDEPRQKVTRVIYEKRRGASEDDEHFWRDLGREWAADAGLFLALTALLGGAGIGARYIGRTGLLTTPSLDISRAQLEAVCVYTYFDTRQRSPPNQSENRQRLRCSTRLATRFL